MDLGFTFSMLAIVKLWMICFVIISILSIIVLILFMIMFYSNLNKGLSSGIIPDDPWKIVDPNKDHLTILYLQNIRSKDKNVYKKLKNGTLKSIARRAVLRGDFDKELPEMPILRKQYGRYADVLKILWLILLLYPFLVFIILGILRA